MKRISILLYVVSVSALFVIIFLLLNFSNSISKPTATYISNTNANATALKFTQSNLGLKSTQNNPDLKSTTTNSSNSDSSDSSSNSGKSGWTISMEPADKRITALSADPKNILTMKVRVTDANGNPVEGARLSLGFEGDEGMISALQRLMGKWGSFSSFSSRTGIDGTITATYKPPEYGNSRKSSSSGAGESAEIIASASEATSNVITLAATVQGTDLKAIFPLKLTRVPVVLIHGYQASPEIFIDLEKYLGDKGYDIKCFSYDSGKGVKYAAGQLDTSLSTLKQDYLKSGIQVGSFDVVAHSLGGLVARYYTCSSAYSAGKDVHKLIFLSVPHNGSMMASFGLMYFNDSSLVDMIPESSLFAINFPSMVNKGLNSSIQTGNILDRYDEVVSNENASLEAWGIKTELFTVGENLMTLGNVLSGTVTDAANHKKVLLDIQIFDRVLDMLNSNLPYPLIRK